MLHTKWLLATYMLLKKCKKVGKHGYGNVVSQKNVKNTMDSEKKKKLNEEVLKETDSRRQQSGKQSKFIGYAMKKKQTGTYCDSRKVRGEKKMPR